MKVSEIIWLEHIIDKIEQKHHVTTYEVEEVLAGKPDISRMTRGHIHGVDVYRALGKTDAGRYLVVIFVLKKNNAIIIISSRDMDAKERRLYGRKKERKK